MPMVLYFAFELWIIFHHGEFLFYSIIPEVSNNFPTCIPEMVSLSSHFLYLSVVIIIIMINSTHEWNVEYLLKYLQIHFFLSINQAMELIST